MFLSFLTVTTKKIVFLNCGEEDVYSWAGPAVSSLADSACASNPSDCECVYRRGFSSYASIRGKIGWGQNGGITHIVIWLIKIVLDKVSCPSHGYIKVKILFSFSLLFCLLLIGKRLYYLCHYFHFSTWSEWPKVRIAKTCEH